MHDHITKRSQKAISPTSATCCRRKSIFTLQLSQSCRRSTQLKSQELSHKSVSSFHR